MDDRNYKKNIAVIGGGASGMTAAIFASKNKDCKVTIFERNDQLGKKILSTGNGHANITNKELLNISEDNVNHYYHTDAPDKLCKLWGRFGYSQIVDFFEDLMIKTMDKNGYIYPYSNQAISVLDAFVNRIENTSNIEVLLNTKINNIKKTEKGYALYYKKSDFRLFDAVILCGGGSAFPKSGSDGTSFYLLDCLNIKYNKIFPALCECNNNDLSSAAGIRCQVSLYAGKKGKRVSDIYEGELQINKESISGIVVFQVSSVVSRLISNSQEAYIYIDFLKDFSTDEVITYISDKSEKYSDMNISHLFDTILPIKLTEALLEKANLKNVKISDISYEELISFINNIKCCEFRVNSVADFEKAQTSTGGIELNAVDDTMQLKYLEDFYACGEVLDVDGICGGYNLSFAFASGAIAGMEVAK